MDWFDKFKRFLGLPERRESPSFYNDDRQWGQPPSPYDDEQDSPFHGGTGRSFSIFTDPLEIHRYFEQQMSEMLRSFGFNEFGDNFGHQFSFPQLDERFGYPQIQEIPDESESGDLRDQFLKPGYEKAKIEEPEQKQDRDIDGKLDIRDWGSVMKGETQKQVTPKRYFFGQSVTMKTVTKPDGSVESHRTVRDNEGNEETTITRKTGDKEYTITKRKDKDGKEETIENLVNLDEKEIENFLAVPSPSRDSPQSWPFFDRLFK